jgi:hypothetical protein
VAPLEGLHALIPRGPHVIVRLLPLLGRSLNTGSEGRRPLGTGSAGKPGQTDGGEGAAKNGWASPD